MSIDFNIYHNLYKLYFTNNKAKLYEIMRIRCIKYLISLFSDVFNLLYI
jgi:hypothetical protein